MLYGQWRENMTTNERNSLEPQVKNGWQNIGICYLFAEDNVPIPLRNIFMALVRRSFGYGQRSTFRTTQVQISNEIGVSERKFRDATKELESLGLLRIENPNLYKKGGGSDPCAYSPVFPTGYGKLYFKDDQEPAASGSNSLQTYNPNEDI